MNTYKYCDKAEKNLNIENNNSATGEHLDNLQMFVFRCSGTKFLIYT